MEFPGARMEHGQQSTTYKGLPYTSSNAIYVVGAPTCGVKNRGDMNMPITKYRSGDIAKVSGQYTIVGPHGGKTGTERTVVRGKPFPPTPNKGQFFVPTDRTKH